VLLSATRLFFQGLYGFDRDMKLITVLAGEAGMLVRNRR
jgi:hypothetical protein